MKAKARMRWSPGRGREIADVKIDNFLKDIVEVCKRHGLSISHEDGHGSFLVEKYADGLTMWLLNAQNGVS